MLPPLGASLSELPFTAVDGALLRIRPFDGGAVVIMLWSSRCSAAQRALEGLAHATRRDGWRGVHVVVIANDADDATVAHRALVDVPSVQSASAEGALSGTFSSVGIWWWRRSVPLPSFLVIDRMGRVSYRQVGIALEGEPTLSALEHAVANARTM